MQLLLTEAAAAAGYECSLVGPVTKKKGYPLLWYIYICVTHTHTHTHTHTYHINEVLSLFQYNIVTLCRPSCMLIPGQVVHLPVTQPRATVEALHMVT